MRPGHITAAVVLTGLLVVLLMLVFDGGVQYAPTPAPTPSPTSSPISGTVTDGENDG